MPTLDTIVVEVIERGPQGPALSNGDKGDITVASNGESLEINAGAVGNAEFRDSAALSVVGRASNSTGDVADISAGTDHHVLRRSGASLGFGLIVNANVDSTAGIAASKISFTQAGTGAMPRLARDKLREIVTPQDFTASTIDDYTTDATSAFQAALDYALATGREVRVPSGTYKISGTLEIGGNGTVLKGTGQKLSTILKSPNADNDIITFANGVSGVQVENLDLDRAVTADAGVCGLRTPDAYIDCQLKDIRSRHSDIGFRLGPVAYAKAKGLVASENASHGIFQTNASGATGSQWYADDCYSANNGGDGWHAEPQADAVGNMPVGEVFNLQTFANDGYGYAAIGRSDAQIPSVRIKGKFFTGQEGNSSIYLDTYGTNHEIQGVHSEENGTIATGPTNSTTATDEGYGLEFTANNGTIYLSDSLCNGHSWSGIYSATPKLYVSNVQVKNNGVAEDSGAQYRSGIYVADGELIGNINSSGTTLASQLYGVYFAQDDTHSLHGHDLRGNNTAPIGAATTLSNLYLSGGIPAEVRCSDVSPPDFALAVSSSDPYVAGTLTNQAAVYLLPVTGRKLPLFNGVNWSTHNAPTNLEHTLNEATLSPAAAATLTNYDIFAYYDRSAGAAKITKGYGWSSATSRGTGSGTTELELFNGMWVNKYAIVGGGGGTTVAARCGLYLGTIRSNVSALIDWNFHNVDVNGSGAANRCAIGVWNMFNRRDLVATWYTSVSDWTYNSQTVRQRNAQDNDQLDIISGLAVDDFAVSSDRLFTSADASVAFWQGFGLDSTTAFYGAYGSDLTEVTGGFPRAAIPDGIPAQIGFHELTVLERIQQASKTATAYGGRRQSTAVVRWRA